MGFLKKIGRTLGPALGLAGAVVSMIPGLKYVGLGMMIAGGVVSALSAEAAKRARGGAPAIAHRVNTRSSREPLKLVYGACEVGVNKTYYHAANPYLHIVAEIGEGPISGIVRQSGAIYTTTGTAFPTSDPPLVYLDGKLWTEYGTGNVTIRLYTGTSTQSVCAELQSATSGAWDEALRYTAYLYVVLRYDPTKFTREPDITLVVHGLVCYDPGAANYSWTSNPALIAYDVMTRSAQRGGMGIPAAEIDTASVVAARDYCDAKGWTCNIPITSRSPVTDYLAQVLACYRGAVIYSEGKYKFRFADLNHESVALALDESDVVAGTLSISSPQMHERPNALRVTYLDSTKHSQPNELVYAPPDAVSADGDYRELQVALYGMSDQASVQKMAAYILESERLRYTVRFEAGERAAVLEPYDLITLTHSMPGWSAQRLRVLSVGVTSDHTVALECVSEHDELYDDTYHLTDQSYHTTTLVSPTEVPDVENISLSEESYVYRLRTYVRLNVSFDPPADYPYFSHAEVWVSLDSGATWENRGTARASFSIDPAQEGATYHVKLVATNIFGSKQDFAAAPYSVLPVTGKIGLAPMSLTSLNAVYTGTTLNVFADRVPDSDVELYEFRLGASWDGGVFLGAFRAPNLAIGGVRPGTHTIWANTLGANGVYGDTPRSATITIQTPAGYTAAITLGPSTNVVTNSDMETTLAWTTAGGASISYTTARQHYGDYSLLLRPGTTSGSVWQTVGAVSAGGKYTGSLWVLPEGSTVVRYVVADGAGNTTYTTTAPVTPAQWNLVTMPTITIGTGGSSARLEIGDPVTTASTHYVDDVIMLGGEGIGACAYYYSGPYVRNTHTTGLVGVWRSPIWDATTNRTWLAYVDSSFVVLGGGNTWSAKFPTTSITWAAAGLNSTVRWSEWFAPSAAPAIRMQINYGPTTALGYTADRAEIMCAVVSGRYFQVETCVTDPDPTIYGMVRSPAIVLCT